jgi:hypothetical protein
MCTYKSYLLLALIGLGLAGCVIHEHPRGYGKYRYGWSERGYYHDYYPYWRRY